MVIRRCIILKL